MHNGASIAMQSHHLSRSPPWQMLSSTVWALHPRHREGRGGTWGAEARYVSYPHCARRRCEHPVTPAVGTVPLGRAGVGAAGAPMTSWTLGPGPALSSLGTGRGEGEISGRALARRWSWIRTMWPGYRRRWVGARRRPTYHLRRRAIGPRKRG